MSQISFHDVCKLWKEEKERYVKLSTMAAYSLIIHNHLEPAFGVLDDVTSESVQRLVDSKLAVGMSESTVKGLLVVLKMLLGFGEKHGLVEHRIIDARFPPNRVRFQMEILSVVEERRLLTYLSSHRDKYSLGLQICLLTGMRIGEVCALKWKDVDIVSGVIRVRRTVHRVYLLDSGPRHSELTVDLPKTTTSYRDIPIIKDLADVLTEYSLKGRSGECFVISGGARPTEPQTMRNHFKRLVASLGIPLRRFHGLRHTFATRCVETRCDYKTLSTILGHTSVSTTLNLYVHPGLEQKRKCVEEMAKSIK